MDQRILRSTNLTAECLADLFTDRILALVVQGYYAPSLCESLSQAILADTRVQRYTHEVVMENEVTQKYFGVDRLGIPFNSTYGGDPIAEENYYREASSGIEHLRRLAAPAPTPADKLRLELDEHFLPGASVAAFSGRKMLAGIGRITKAELSAMSAEQPHFDALPARFGALDAQFAANIYLRVPPLGGELELWDVPPMDPLAKTPADWRSELPPSVKIAPQLGDLILFNCRRPHAIGAFTGEDRVSVQMFLGYRKGEALLLWN